MCPGVGIPGRTARVELLRDALAMLARLVAAELELRAHIDDLAAQAADRRELAGVATDGRVHESVTTPARLTRP